jgi:hypothetical protein
MKDYMRHEQGGITLLAVVIYLACRETLEGKTLWRKLAIMASRVVRSIIQDQSRLVDNALIR